MAWDKAEPQDTTKIRNLGTVIRPNWVAIEDAETGFKPAAINFNDRTVAGYSNDPTAIADAYITYCKTDGAGNSELFGIDENSVVSQFTSTDRTLSQTGYSLLPPGMLLQWGRGTMAGGTATLAVTFPKAFSSTAWVVTSTPYAITITGSSPREWGVNSITSTGFTANSFNGVVPGGGVPFGWMAIGPL